MAYLSRFFQLLICQGTVINRSYLGILFSMACPLVDFLCLCFRDNLYHFGFTPAERDLIPHDLILHGVHQWCIQKHLYLFPFDEAHLHDSLPEASVSRYFDDDAVFAGV